MKLANKWLTRTVAGMLAIGAAPFAVAATELCVSSTSDLNGALQLVQFQPLTIKLVQGNYVVEGTPLGDSYFFQKNTLSMLGGYTAGCTGRDIAANNTVIAATSTHGITWDIAADLTIEGLTFDANHGEIFLKAGDNVIDVPDLPADIAISIRRSVFSNTHTDFGDDGAMEILWELLDQDATAHVSVIDSLFYGSTGGASTCGLKIESVGPGLNVRMVNNTIANNDTDNGLCIEGFDADGDPSSSEISASLYNNILWNNGARDLYSSESTLLLVNNTIGIHSYPTQLLPPIGTLTSNPKLDASYRLTESPVSPAINSGTEDVSGGLPATDLDGRARVIGGAPDRGAYESNINNALIQPVTNTHDSGSGSLREAIDNANAASGFNIIVFDIGSSCGPHVIALDSALPSITSSVFINGYTQSGSAENDLDSGDDAVICVVLDSGDSASTGLRIGPSVSSSVHLDVAGLAFSGFSYAALDLKGGSDHVVAGNHFGGSVGGVSLSANQTNVWIGTGVSGATIGGDDVSQRNIISGALGDGVHLDVPSATQPGANHNQVVNNYIGTTHSGEAAFANGTGINIGGDHNTLQRNLIAGNTFEGVWMSGAGAHNNLIDTNNIGNLNGNSSFGNGASGVRIDGAARDNAITSNLIDDNGFGVRVVNGVHNRISKNSILRNGGLGIDLAGEGVTVNDDDGGIAQVDYANDGLNFPVLTEATGSALSGSVSGTLTTVPGAYTVQLFVSGDCDDSSHGEGWTWRRTINVTIPDPPFGTGQGTATFTTSIKPGVEVTLLGKFITATASSAAGDTSEFSACRLYTDDTIFANPFEATP